jgi:chitinase
VGSVVTDAFFNGIKNQAGSGCEGSNFYTRDAFVSAAGAYSGFAHGGSADDGKREIAAFFAHVTHETGRKLIERNTGIYDCITYMYPVLNSRSIWDPVANLYFIHLHGLIPADFCYISEINKADSYCDSTKTQWPCASGKKYYGRGPLQISWNYNYGPAGQSIGFDGLGNPDAVAQDAVVAFKTAFWFWMNNVHGGDVAGIRRHHQGHQRQTRVRRQEHR